MINLLKFEWRKLCQSKLMYIVYGLGLLSLTLMIVLSKVMGAPASNASLALLNGISGSSMISLTGIFLALFATNDYSQHTIKNIYARGYSRTAVYFSKYLVSLAVVFVVAIAYMCYGFLLMLMTGNPAQGLTAAGCGNLALQALWLVGMHGLFFGLSTMVARPGVAVALNVVGITLLFSLLNTLLSLCFAKVPNYNFNLTDYQLEYVLMTLLSDAALTTAELLKAILLPIGYAVVFVTGGWLVNQRRDA